MFTHQHPADHLLLLAADGELGPSQMARLRAHIDRCGDCQQRRDRLQLALHAYAHDTNPELEARPADHAGARLRLRQAMQGATLERAAGWTWHLPRALQSLQMPLAFVVLVLGLALSLASVTSSGVDWQALNVSHLDLPNGTLTPGAVSSLDAPALCAGERPSRTVGYAIRARVLADYGMQNVDERTYELDALITPDLGGTATRANLWPQRYSATWNAHVKDALENLLATRVCQQQMPLAAAQQALAGDWVSAYRHYFNTKVPLPEHIAAADADQDLIVDSRMIVSRREAGLLTSMLLVSCPSCQR